MSKDSQTRGRVPRTRVSSSLAAYRKDHPLQTKLPVAPIAGGLRELVEPSTGACLSLHSFSTAEAAHALGRSLLTFRKWKEAGLVPQPIFQDAIRGWGYYVQEEIDAIASALAVHEQTHQYYGVGHTETRARVRRAVDAARAALLSSFGQEN